MLTLLRSRKFWASVFSALLTLALWYLQMLTPSPIWPFSDKEVSCTVYKELIFPYKVEIGIFIAVVLLLTNFALNWVPPNRKKKKLIKCVLKEILFQLFGGDTYHNRITLFQQKNGFETLFVYIWKCLIVNLRHHMKKQCVGYYIKNIPSPFKKYLHIYAREGQPYSKGTSTIFTAACTDKEVDGFASLIWLRQSPLHVKLPDISNIDLKNAKRIEDLSKGNQTIVKKYMRFGKITDFNKLKTLHRLSTNLWGTPVLDENQEMCGVLVFDDNNPNQTFGANNDLNERLIGYTRILEKTSAIKL